MGWWKMNLETGGIDCDCKTEVEGLLNAIPNKDSAKCFFGGDKPSDIMTKAIKDIHKEYEKAWGRKARKAEIMEIYGFRAK